MINIDAMKVQLSEISTEPGRKINLYSKMIKIKDIKKKTFPILRGPKQQHLTYTVFYENEFQNKRNVFFFFYTGT